MFHKLNHKKLRSTLSLSFLFSLTVGCLSVHANTDDKRTLEDVLIHKVENEKVSVGIAVAVIENDQVRYINVGVADKNIEQKINQNTLFEIGSISKVMTSTALATFVEDKQLSLSEPIQKYLPKSVRIPERESKPITFESLANHTSGLPRLPTNMPFGDPLNPYNDYTTEMMFQFLSEYTLPRVVGAQAEYSNLGAGLLGYTLAKVDETTFERMLKARVLQPLKMNSTYITVPDSKNSTRSLGHNGNLDPTPYWQLPALAGAGAVVSNSSDMARFLKANMEKSGLPESISLSQKPTTNMGNPNTRVGLGWIIQKTAKGDVYLHDGQTGGFASFIGFNATLNKGIVILSNTSVSLNDVGFSYLTDALSSLKLFTPVNVSAKQLTGLLGEYEVMSGFVLSVTKEDNQLFVQGTGQPKLPLKAISNNEFINDAVKAKIVFKLDESGSASSLTLYQGGQSLPGRKL